MLPIRDNAPSRSLPWVVLTLVALNSLVLCLEATPALDSATLVISYGLVPSRFLHWCTFGGHAYDARRFLPILSSMFLHDGWLHLATNMLYLWTFGRALEDRLGRFGLAATFFLSGIAAALGQIIAHPHSNAAMVGASGAIAGILGAYLICFPRAKVTLAFPFFYLPWVLRVRAVWFLIGWFALQLGKGVSDLLSGTTDPQVAWWAHTAGFIAGMSGALAGRVWQQAPEAVPAPIEPSGTNLRPSRVPAVLRSSRVPQAPVFRTSFVP